MQKPSIDLSFSAAYPFGCIDINYHRQVENVSKSKVNGLFSQ